MHAAPVATRHGARQGLRPPVKLPAGPAAAAARTTREQEEGDAVGDEGGCPPVPVETKTPAPNNAPVIIIVMSLLTV